MRGTGYSEVEMAVVRRGAGGVREVPSTISRPGGRAGTATVSEDLAYHFHPAATAITTAVIQARDSKIFRSFTLHLLGRKYSGLDAAAHPASA